jgi:hypothetical protein
VVAPVRKGHTNVLIITAVMLGLGLTGLMIGLAGNVAKNVEESVRTNTVYMKGDTLADFIQTHHTEQAMNWSFYQTSYELAWATDKNVKEWDKDYIPSISEIETELLDKATEDFRDNYLDDVDVPPECQLVVPDFEYITHNNTGMGYGVEGINYTSQSDGAVAVSCSKPRARYEDHFAPNMTDFSATNRFFYMYNMTQHLVKADGFRDIIADTVRNSSNYAIALNEEHAGDCLTSDCAEQKNGANIPYMSWDDVEDDFVHEQAELAADDLEEELQRWNDGDGPYAGFEQNFIDLDDRYHDLNVTFKTAIDYDVIDKTPRSVYTDDQKDQDWHVSDCTGTCSTTWDTWTCSTSCGPVGSPPAGTCPVQDGGENNDICSESSMVTAETRGADGLWTEDPWTLNDGETHSTDPFPLVSFDNQMDPFEQGWDTRVRGHPDPDCGDSPDCDGEGVGLCGTCQEFHNHNGVTQRTRSVWEINQIRATARVTVIINDTSYRTPTDKGHINMSFRTEYTQEQEWNFQGGHDDVTHPDGVYECSDADFYGRVC